jgi:hypothetical protein
MTPYSRTHEFTAWGERRSVSAWAKDERCAIMLETLWKRLREGWEPERAQ